ncbi:DUF2024 family protein [Inhella sp.]|uniref:DUF2024 family protein n=1 Tax=Inhella sp. TaxID=1921806 RepID=UPI0035B18215
MEIAVYDTYVPRPDGRVMHFDVLVPAADHTLAQVLVYARLYLASKGLPNLGLDAQACHFCHTEYAAPGARQAIEQAGYAIIELAHCQPASPVSR